MKTSRRILLHLYTMLTRLYPRDFREEFGEEMRMVFEQAAAEAGGKGGTALTGLCLREGRDWPGALLAAYWSGIREGIWRYIMSEMDNGERWEVQSPRDAFISAAAPLLFGLGAALSAFALRDFWQEGFSSTEMVIAIVLGLVPTAVVAVGGFMALVKRLPIWGYTWSGAALMGFVVMVKTIAEERADVGMPLISQAMDAVVGAVLLLGIFALLAAAAIRGWRQAGLVSIGFTAMMVLSLYFMLTAAPFKRHDLALLAAPVGLLIAGLIYLYHRGEDASRFGVLIGMGLVNVVTLWVANQVWGPWLASHSRPSPVLPLFVMLMGMLLSGPVLGLLRLPLRRIFRRA